MLKSIIIESVDMLGKDTLIRGIKNALGYFQVIHYQKPEILDSLKKDALIVSSGEQDTIQTAQKMYQVDSFITMMNMLSTDSRFIMNRAHLGECVYAHRYRGYSGDYVFNLEHGRALDTTLLVLLHTSSFDFVKDDGLSFDFSKKEEEQADFKIAFEKSSFKHKLMLDVHDGSGNFRPKVELVDAVVEAYLKHN